MRVALLWFEDCPNHEAAESFLREGLIAEGVDVAIERVEVPDEATGIRVVFPGSPTIRIDGKWNPAGSHVTTARLAAGCTRQARAYAGYRNRRG